MLTLTLAAFVFFTLTILGHFAYSIWKIKKYLHILQLNSYYNKRYWNWLVKKRASLLSYQDLEPLIALAGLCFNRPIIVPIVTTIIYFKLLLELPSTTAKKPLVFTARAKRIFAANMCLPLLLYGCLLWALMVNGGLLFGLAMGTLVLFNILQPLTLIVTNWLLSPLEKAIQSHYLRQSKIYLESLDQLKIIGITGSFGKTTTKYIVTELLKQKFNVLKTPASYNTPMGITKVIRSELKPIHEIFVVEMSAKQRGDIKKICDLVAPQWGIITAVGEQHLETFLSIDHVKKTKNELIESLPTSGTAFFNIDDPISQELATLAKCHVVTYGIKNKGADYQAYDVVTNENGSSFTVRTATSLSPTYFTTSLLGEHNISNILSSIALASTLGVSLEAMVYPIKQLRAVPHRLEIKKIHDNIIIIDDAFNANPRGSAMALEVLAQFRQRRKIVVTPGMVELGSREELCNQQFGTQMTQVCDYIILVGQQQTLPIQMALTQENYSPRQLFVAANFAAAKQHLELILQPNDVVLFENDLPDNYNEI